MNDPVTFKQLTIRVPESGVVRIPRDYPHEFASLPSEWDEVTTKARYVIVPYLDDATLRSLRSTWGSRWPRL